MIQHHGPVLGRSGPALRSGPACHAGAKRARVAPDALIVSLLLFLATLATAQTQPATTQPGIDEDLAKAHYPWLVLNYTAKGYRLHVTVNGADYATFETGEGSDTRPTPLKAGKNEIVVDLTRTAPTAAHGSEHGAITVEAVPRQVPKDDDERIGIADLEVDEHDQGSGGRITVTLDYVDTQPRAFTTRQQTWSDAEHKKLTWQYDADGDFLAEEIAHEKEQSWRDNGKLAKESVHQNGKLAAATAYKPDGTIAAEVKAGQGVDASYDDDGHCESTVAIKDGQPHGEQTTFFDDGKPSTITTWKDGSKEGPFKRYDETGKLRVTGQMKDNMPDGVWRKLDDDGKPVADCEYKDGLLVKGDNLYTPEP